MVLPAPVRLPVRVLADLVARSGLGELHVSLAPAPVWRDGPADDHTELLTALGWVRRGTVEREVLAALAVLCRPQTGFHGWISHERRTTSVLAAAVGREAVLAVRAGDTVSVSGAGRLRLADRLVGCLPPVPAGRGPVLHVGLDALAAVDRHGRVRVAGGIGSRPAPAEARRARRLIAAPTTGAGELHVVGGPRPVTYVDTVHGRYLVDRQQEAVVIRPAAGADLVAELCSRLPVDSVGNSRPPHDPVG